MKKRFLLAIIPACLALSACGVKPVAQNNLKEDVVAHEEIFGDAQVAGQLLPKRANDVSSEPTADPNPLKPKIGIQYKYTDNNSKISIRYVAAISSLNVKAKWHRGVAMQDSNCPIKFYDNDAPQYKVASKAYRAINNDGQELIAASLGGGYQYFVVYTLLDVPLSTYQWSYLAAYLELTDYNDVELTSSEVVAVNIDQKHHFSFEKDDFNGYFIEGTINGAPNSFKALDDSHPGNNAQETLDLKANDNFGVFQWTPTEFHYYGNSNFAYDSFYMELDTSISTNYSRVKLDLNYTIYVNSTNGFGIGPTAYGIDLYLDTGIWDDANQTEGYAVYYKKNADLENDEWLWTRMAKVTDQKLYVIENFDVASHPKFILCRLNSSDAELKWENVWNQTSDISFVYAGGNPEENEFKITDWGSNGKDCGYERHQYPTPQA